MNNYTHLIYSLDSIWNTPIKFKRDTLKIQFFNFLFFETNMPKLVAGSSLGFDDLIFIRVQVSLFVKLNFSIKRVKYICLSFCLGLAIIYALPLLYIMTILYII